MVAVAAVRTLKSARKSKRLTQGQLAEMVGVSQGFISDVELGNRTPSEELYTALKEVVGDFQYGPELKRVTDPGNELKRVVTRGNAVVPFYRHYVKAGDGGHVLDDDVEEFDVEAHYKDTCVYKVSGDSMIEAGVDDGDRLVVNLGYKFENNDMILCRYNGDLMVKFGRIDNGVIWLIPANKKHHPWPCKSGDQFEAIGVVKEIIKDPDNDFARRVDLSKFKEG
jgi:transcriptional regulator with XRE-family HTH domain